jgi:hypothetical protein
MNEYIDFSNKQQLNDTNLLFNKNKISADIASLSSMSSISSSSSIKSNSHMNKKQLFHPIQQEPKKLINPNKKVLYTDDDNKSSNGDDDDEEEESDESEDEGSEDESDDEDDDESGDGEKADNSSKLKPYKNELNEKKEILYQLNRLKLKGHTIPINLTMQTDIEEMRQEYNKIIRDKEIDASVRFQRKMLMAFVTGTEYLNTRYDPFAIKLDGWSEQVHENLSDFDDIFEELHVKYKSKGKSMPPELRLFVSLSGSAFMFHLTSKMFKESSIPGVEEVLKANPELMKQFQNAAAKQFIYNNIGSNSTQKQPQQSQPVKQESSSGVNSLFGNSSGLFGMVNNLFSGLNNSSPFQEMPSMKPENDINKIINNVHNKISIYPDEDNRIETLSISDEEITSIIEDATDVKILKSSTRGRKPNNRTLNI